MHEIALRTTERKLQKPNRLCWRPVGSTMVCISDSLRRRKWLEICCDLVSPKKRDKFKGIPGWAKLCDAWTQDLWDAWFAADASTEQHKIGRLLMDNSYPQQVWKELIEPIGVLADLPFAPESDLKVYDTWLWSDKERAVYFIVTNEDADDVTVQSWGTAEDRDADTGEVLPELSEGEVRDSRINVATVWARQIRYTMDLELSGGTLADIANSEKILHPRFDKPVASAKVIQPDIALAVEATG